MSVQTGRRPSNGSLLTSATEVSSSPQTVVYHINPLAVWSNGVPITYRDFVYNWEAQSGRAAFRDAGGACLYPSEPEGLRRHFGRLRGPPLTPAR